MYKWWHQFKIEFFNFIFLNTDFSFTTRNIQIKLCEHLHNFAVERSVSQIFNLGPGSDFMR